MEIRRFGVGVAGYVLLIPVCALANTLVPAFLITAAAALLLLVTGIALFPRFRVRFIIPIPNVEPGPLERYSFQVAGVDIPLRLYAQAASCTLTPRRIPELVACVVIASATLAVVASGSRSYLLLLSGPGVFALEGACFASAVVLLVSLAWFDECRLLRGARFALATTDRMQSILSFEGLKYEFVEHDNRYVGYTRSFGGTPENIVIVFYKPGNPNHNRAHRSLLFHQLRVHSVGALRLPKKVVDEQAHS